MVMAVNKTQDNSFTIYTDIADKDNTIVKIGSGNTINNAIYNINNETSGQLFLGHLSGIIVDDGCDYRDIKSLVVENNVIGRDIPVIYCNNIEDILNDDNVKLSDFITKYFNNYNHKKINVEAYINEKRDNDSLPVLAKRNEELVIYWY